MQAKGLFIQVLFVLMTKASLISGQSNQKILVTAMGEDVGYRVRLTNKHLEGADCQRKLNTGQQVLTALRGKPIKLWVHFSHGHHSRMFGKTPQRKISYFSNGFIISPHVKHVGKHSATLDDLRHEIALGNIQFAPNSLIILGACAVAVPSLETGFIFAQELADITGASVIAGEHKTEPLKESERTMVFTNVQNFIKFRPYQTPLILGSQLDLVAQVKTHLREFDQQAAVIVQQARSASYYDNYTTHHQPYSGHTQVEREAEVATRND